MSRNRKRVRTYVLDRVIGIGTGKEEGSIMAIASQPKYPAAKVAVIITPDFLGELAKVVADDVADVLPPPQPVVDAVYDEPPTLAEQLAESQDEMDAAVAAIENEGGPALADAGVATE